MKVGFVSLGCSKNLVDTEMAIGLMKKLGFEIVSDPSQAEMIIINTCGFIQSAKEEAIQTIFEMAEYKISDDYMPDLYLMFENGILVSVNKHSFPE